MGQTESTASELVNAFYVGLFFPSSSSSFAFPWYFLWYPITITSTLLNYTHLLSRSFAHTHINVMRIKYVLRVCVFVWRIWVCVFQFKIIVLFIRTTEQEKTNSPL